MSNNNSKSPFHAAFEKPVTHRSGWRAVAVLDECKQIIYWEVRNEAGTLIANHLSELDAKLFAAGPEMYESLKEMIQINDMLLSIGIETFPKSGEKGSPKSNAVDAIAKAAQE